MDDAMRPKTAAKRKAARDILESVKTSLKKSPKSSNLQSEESRRTQRHRGDEGQSVYSSDWHPMDGLVDLDEVTEVGTDSNDEDSNSETEQSPNITFETDDTTLSLSDVNIDSTNLQQHEAKSIEGNPGSEDVNNIGPQTPRRRSVRFAAGTKSPFKYDQRVHPLDVHTKPKYIARLNQQLKSALKSNNRDQQKIPAQASEEAKAPLDIDHDLQPIPDQTINNDGFSSFSPLPCNENPYLSLLVLRWSSLEDFDQQLFLSQKGAPICASTLPCSWQKVKKTLFDQGLLTLDQLICDEATKQIISRYCAILSGLQAFYKSVEDPTDRKDWLVFPAETFRMLDQKPKAKNCTKRETRVGEIEMRSCMRELGNRHIVKGSYTMRSTNALTEGSIAEKVAEENIEYNVDPRSDELPSETLPESERVLMQIMEQKEPLLTMPDEPLLDLDAMDELFNDMQEAAVSVGLDTTETVIERQLTPSEVNADIVNRLSRSHTPAHKKRKHMNTDFAIFEDGSPRPNKQTHSAQRDLQERRDTQVENLRQEHNNSQHSSHGHETAFDTPRRRRRLNNSRIIPESP